MTDANAQQQPPSLELTETRESSTIVLAAAGRIDALTAKQFESAVLASVQDGATPLVLDFDRLRYISSAGLRVILLAAKRQKQNSAKFALCNLRDEVRDVFEISGFAKMLDIHPSRDAAVAA